MQRRSRRQNREPPAAGAAHRRAARAARACPPAWLAPPPRSSRHDCIESQHIPPGHAEHKHAGHSPTAWLLEEVCAAGALHEAVAQQLDTLLEDLDTYI